MFSVITNIYNKKTKGPTLMELFTTTGKLKCQGTSGAIASEVGHFQTHALSNVLVTLCSGTDEPHGRSERA
jgi:hypothetical protein